MTVTADQFPPHSKSRDVFNVAKYALDKEGITKPDDYVYSFGTIRAPSGRLRYIAVRYGKGRIATMPDFRLV